MLPRFADFDDLTDAARITLCQAFLAELLPLFERGRVKLVADEDAVQLRARLEGRPFRVSIDHIMGWVRLEMKVENRVGHISLEWDRDKRPQQRDPDDDWADQDDLRVFLAAGVFVQGDEYDVERTLASVRALRQAERHALLSGMERLEVGELTAWDDSLVLSSKHDLDGILGPRQRMVDAVAWMGAAAAALEAGEGVGSEDPFGDEPPRRVPCPYCSTLYVLGLRDGCPNCGAPYTG